MPYEYYIKRKEDRNKITLQEWLDYVESQSNFSLVHEQSAILPDGKELKVKTPNSGVWKSPKHDVPFNFSEKYGWISIPRAPDWVIVKMIEMADYFDAIVEGESGHVYDEEFLIEYHENNQPKKVDKPWWKFW